MKLHEFQAKQILETYGIPIPDFFVISSLDELEELLHFRGWDSVVLKVQIHAGGRGKGGGVRTAQGHAAIRETAANLLGKKIINEQTGPQGLIAHQLLLSPLLPIEREYYLGITIDRERGTSVLLASPSGGVDIEQMAEENPKQILFLPIPPEGFLSYHFLRLSKWMGWKGELARQGEEIVSALVKAFKETDASLLEINPLVQTPDHQLFALDAKLVIDDQALYRQPLFKDWRDLSQINPQEALALQHDLSYIALDGEIGCMVNGAGLAMATLDLLHHFGGRAANFLDVGGGASQEKVAEGFKIILCDPKVKSILVNIFGGIMNCETLAAGIVQAAKDLSLSIPLIVRLEGTYADQGKQRLKDSGLNIISASDLKEAAQKAVKMAKICQF